jgi:hypothetical protein
MFQSSVRHRTSNKGYIAYAGHTKVADVLPTSPQEPIVLFAEDGGSNSVRCHLSCFRDATRQTEAVIVPIFRLIATPGICEVRTVMRVFIEVEEAFAVCRVTDGSLWHFSAVPIARANVGYRGMN